MKYIFMMLRKIEWTDKSTGELKSSYAWSSSNGGTVKVHGKELNANVKFFINGEKVSNQSNGLTVWLSDMTPEEFKVYEEMGQTTGYARVDGQPGTPECTVEVITVQEYEAVPADQRLPLYA